MRDEADPRAAMAAHDGPLVLPVVTGKARPLVFRRWRDEPLVPGPFGTAHPADSAEVLTPRVLIVPLAGSTGRETALAMAAGSMTGRWNCCENRDR